MPSASVASVMVGSLISVKVADKVGKALIAVIRRGGGAPFTAAVVAAFDAELAARNKKERGPIRRIGEIILAASEEEQEGQGETSVHKTVGTTVWLDAATKTRLGKAAAKPPSAWDPTQPRAFVGEHVSIRWDTRGQRFEEQ